ncbi:hypothetical protein KA005_00815 [bacterium]|nr:hypothetical protein [bacterium]
MNSWITIIGSSPFALINTLWAACKIDGYVPDRVLFIVNEQLGQAPIDTAKRWVYEILKEYGVKEPIFEEISVNETDFIDLKETFKGNISAFKTDGAVAVDMTPGRKYMSAITMHTGLEERADHVYYLHLSDNKYQNKPFPLIPMYKQRLVDMVSENIMGR